MTEPVVVNAISDPAPKKLNHAIENRKPLLIVAIRDEVGEKVLAMLDEFCHGKNEFVCAYARKGEDGFNPFSEWLGDQGTENSQLLVVNSEDFTKTLFDGDLTKATDDTINKFVTPLFEEIKAKAEEAEKQQEKEQEKEQEVEVQVEESEQTQEEPAKTEEEKEKVVPEEL